MGRHRLSRPVTLRSAALAGEQNACPAAGNAAAGSVGNRRAQPLVCQRGARARSHKHHAGRFEQRGYTAIASYDGKLRYGNAQPLAVRGNARSALLHHGDTQGPARSWIAEGESPEGWKLADRLRGGIL